MSAIKDISQCQGTPENLRCISCGKERVEVAKYCSHHRNLVCHYCSFVLHFFEECELTDFGNDVPKDLLSCLEQLMMELKVAKSTSTDQNRLKAFIPAMLVFQSEISSLKL